MKMPATFSRPALAATASALAFACVSSAAAEPREFPVDKISEHVYVIHGPTEFPNKANAGFMNNPVIVETADSLVVIDPGSGQPSGEIVLRAASSISKKPISHVFNSHVHGDHWLGNDTIRKAYPNVEVHAHPKMIEEVKAGADTQWLGLMSRMTEGATDGTQAMIPTHALSDQPTLMIGGLSFRAHLTEHAHTRTDAMIEIVEDRVIVLGDNGFNQRFGRMDDGSFRGTLKNCANMLGRDFAAYVPGHGPSGPAESALAPYCHFIERVYSAAGKAVETGRADFEIKPELHAELTGFHSWPGYEEEFGRSISLAILEAERASFE